MLYPYRDLPPLTTLRAFEAAARHESFTRAAEELCLTQSAVSRHVRSLETHLGVVLFRREHRGVHLTPAGKDLWGAVSMGFGHIATATKDVRRQNRTGKLSVGMVISFASLFLALRIGNFSRAFPEIDVNVVALERNPVPADDGFDIAIVLAYQPEPGYESQLLFTEEVFPVCGPTYLAGRDRLEGPADLVKETLLHMDDRYWSGFPWTPINWSSWMGRFGVKLLPHPHGLIFNNYPMMIQTAVRGYGIGLGWQHVISDHVREGALVRPLRETYHLDRGHHLVVPSRLSQREDVIAFSQWFRSEVDQYINGKPVSVPDGRLIQATDRQASAR